jgi:hypothetical protein
MKTCAFVCFLNHQYTKARLQPKGIWADKFDFVFFTESDQLLVMREFLDLYRHLLRYPRRMILPHRLMPYPPEVLQYKHKKVSTTQNQKHAP